MIVVICSFVCEERGLFESLSSEIVNVEFSTVGYRFFSFLGYRTETLCMHVENCKM